MSEIKILIDGQEVKTQGGQNLLEIILAAGIEMPHLCYQEQLRPYGGCGLCLVEIEGSRKLFRACSTSAEDGMSVITQSLRINSVRRQTLALLLSDHRGDCIAPCKNACPGGNDCQGYIGLIANGRYDEAISLIKETIPLPACIGRICPHPCQEACRRDLLEGTLHISHLKQFAADLDLAKDQPYLPKVETASGKKVAIVGAGPSGLSAAYFLAQKGHQIKIYEAMPKPGGMLRYGIPKYRLPREVLDKEIFLIEELGVEICCSQKLGQDIELEELRRKYDAVYIAVGAWKSSPLGCQGDDLPGILGGIEFLKQLELGCAPALGKKVAVVGGGNTAIDVARSAIRLGSDVTLVYRRSRAEMPAEPWEVNEAEEEGLNLRFLSAVSGVFEANGQAAGLRMQKMRLGAPDESGRPKPEPIPGQIEEQTFDNIIAAVGQQVSGEGLMGLALSPKKTIVADVKDFSTNLEGVFAGGDATNRGPGIAIEAIADGKNAAFVIDGYIRGEQRTFAKPFMVADANFSKDDLKSVPPCPSVPLQYQNPQSRVKDFSEIVLPYSEKEAQAEAFRCLECGCDALYSCRLLPLLRQYEAYEQNPGGSMHRRGLDLSHPLIRRDIDKCILCGLCVRVCSEKVGAMALDFMERGFDSQASPPFMQALAADADCISCGECVVYCPTGALSDRWPLGKTPPLAATQKAIVCPYCSEHCHMVGEYYGDWLLRVLPEGNERACSLGRYGLPLESNAASLDRLDKQEEMTLLRNIQGDLMRFNGEMPEFVGINDLISYLQNLRA